MEWIRRFYGLAVRNARLLEGAGVDSMGLELGTRRWGPELAPELDSGMGSEQKAKTQPKNPTLRSWHARRGYHK